MRAILRLSNGEEYHIFDADATIKIGLKDEVNICGYVEGPFRNKNPHEWLDNEGPKSDDKIKFGRPTHEELCDSLSDDELNYILNNPCVVEEIIRLIRHKLQPYEPLIEFLSIEVFSDKFVMHLRVGAEYRRIARQYPFYGNVVDEIIESVVKDGGKPKEI